MDRSNTTPYHLPSDAVWFITGCSSGIGSSLAQLIAKSPSYRLVATARKPASLSSIPDGTNVLKLSLDVTSTQSTNAAIAAALEKFGRIDVMVNNAGYALEGDTENATEDEERAEMETLFWGPVRLSKHAMRIMRDENPKTGQQGGVVLNVTSVGGFVGFPGSAFYHAGKFAVEGFTESVAKEMRPEWNIHFCLIEPGGVQTDFATRSMNMIKPHPAYDKPDSPSRVLMAYMADAKNRETWASPEDAADRMLHIVSRGKRIPIRVPLGPSAWASVQGEVELVKKELEELKELNGDDEHPDHLETISFLNKATTTT